MKLTYEQKLKAYNEWNERYKSIRTIDKAGDGNDY